MYKIETIRDQDQLRRKATAKPPFGPKFSEDQVAQADAMEVWGSSFDDDGPDFCLFKLMKYGEVIYTKKVEGY